MRDEIRERRRRAADEYCDRFIDEPDEDDLDGLSTYYHNNMWAASVYYKDAMATGDMKTAVQQDRIYGYWLKQTWELDRRRERS